MVQDLAATLAVPLREPRVTVERAESGQHSSALVAELFETYYDRIARYIAVRTGNPSEAEDLASEVFVRAVEKIDSFEWRGIPVQAWLFRIAHNLIVDYFRRTKRHPVVPLDDNAHHAGAEADPEVEVLRRMEMADVQQAMQHLTSAQREVLNLRLVAGLPSAEVAAILGKKDGAVREMQHAALKTLRRVLESQAKGASRA